MGTLIFKIRGDPFFSEPPYSAAFFEEIGRICALWGRFDWFFSHALLTASLIAGHEFEKGGFPRSMKKRLDAWRIIFKRYPELAKFSKAAMALADHVSSTATDRNLIIHSHWNGFEDGEPPRIKFHNIQHRGRRLQIKPYTLPLSTLVRVRDEIDHAQTKLVAIDWPLSALHPGPKQFPR